MINLPNGFAELPMIGFGKPAFAVLPIDPRTKSPRCFKGVFGASNDLKTIQRMFRAAPGSGVAVATGKVSGIDVIDM